MSDQSNNWREALDDLSEIFGFEDSFFEDTHNGPTLSSFDTELDSLAQKAFDGEYGASPFDPSTEGYRDLIHDAYEKVGAHMPDEFWQSEDGSAGGAVLDSIHARCDGLAIKADEVSNDFAASAFAMEKEDAATYANPVELQSRDKTVLDADNPQILVDAIVAGNEGRAERGEQPITLHPETISELESRGVDVSGLVSTNDGNDQSAPNKVDTGDVYTSPSANPDITQDTVGAGARIEVPDNNDGGHPSVDNVTRFMDNEENAFVTIERDDAGEPKDIIAIDEDGNETRLSDILADLAGADERIENIFGHALEMADNGEDWKEFLQTSLAQYAEELQAPRDVVQNDGNDTDVPASETDPLSKYQERADYHKGEKDKINAVAVPLYKDTFSAYHSMAEIYNAYRGGTEVNGKVPTMVDVVLAANKFVGTNIVETLIVHAIRGIFEKPERNDVEQSQERPVSVERPATDNFGIPESGRIETPVDDKTAKDIAAFRKDLPEAAKAYGADMTKVDRGSRDDITIRTTNPDNVGGRGVSITLDSAKRFVVPDFRLIDFKGERLLVDPFGKVMDVVSGGDKFSVGQTISGLDISSTEKGKAAIETYARDKGISVEQAKSDISTECMARFCERIEDSYRVEARAIERTVIPRELETRADIESKIANLGRMEQGATSPDAKAAISERRIELQGARDTIDGRISALKERVDQLHSLADRGIARSLGDRFSDAIASEKGAIGRSVTTVDFGVDMPAVSAEVKAGVEDIKAKVEAYNADRPEMDRISYDSKTGDFVDRFGINDKGEYVGNTNGKFMGEGVTGPETAEQRAEYIKEHYEPERFADIEKILTSDVDRPENNDVEKPNANNETADANNDPVERQADPTETPKDPTEVNKDPTETTNDPTEKNLGNGDNVDNPVDGANIDQDGNKANPTEKPGETSDTEKGQEKEGAVENPNEAANADNENNADAIDQTGDGTDGEQVTGDAAGNGGDVDGNGDIGGEDIEVLADEEATTNEATAGDTDNSPEAVVNDGGGGEGNDTESEYNEFGKGGDIDADTELKDPNEVAGEEAAESDVEEIISDVTANAADGIDTIAENVAAIDKIDDTASAPATTPESSPSGEVATETAPPDTTGTSQAVEITPSAEVPASDTAVNDWGEQFGKALADLDPAAGKEAVSDFITAQSDSLSDVIKGIEDPAEKSSAISELAHSVLNAFNDWVGGVSPEQAEAYIEVGANFMEGMLGSLDMDTAIDVAFAVRDAQNDAAYEANYDKIDAITDGLESGLEPFMAEYYELDDGLVILPDGTVDGATGDETGGFSSNPAADQFTNDVAQDVADDLKNVNFAELPNTDVDYDGNDQVAGNDNEINNLPETEIGENDFPDHIATEPPKESALESALDSIGDAVESFIGAFL